MTKGCIKSIIKLSNEREIFRMAMNSVEAIINHSLTISKMIADEREQERKHALNPRCKPANYAGVAGYIEYATGIQCTADEVEKALTRF